MASTVASEQRNHDFDAKSLTMTHRALSHRENLHDSWRLFDLAKCIGVYFSPPSFGVLLVECEQKGFFEHETAILKGEAGCKHGMGVRDGRPAGYKVVIEGFIVP